MRKLLTWLLVTVGIAALVRRLRRRGLTPELSAPAAPPLDDPANELRRKLAETRSESGPPEATVPERRAEVHDEGRAALDEMRSRADQ